MGGLVHADGKQERDHLIKNLNDSRRHWGNVSSVNPDSNKAGKLPEVRGQIAEGKRRVAEIEKEMQRVDLLPGAQRRHNQMPRATLLAIALVMLIEQREGAFGGRSRAGECRRQSLIRTPDFVISLVGH